MRVENLRDIAIIAHVDHGKTTLCDKLLRAAGAFRANQEVQERVLDSNDQERERGITILAKNISIDYNGVKINIIDTPGHADFGGEVERVLRMADGALLLVDAFEGPMPQTRFVLRHAIDTGLYVMIVINKIDRPGADPEKAYNDCLDLMADLGATDEQLEFAMEHVVYCSGVNGYARLDPEDGNMDMYPLLDMIVNDLPAPEVDVDGPLAMQCVTIDHSNFVGRIGIGRVYSGTIHTGDQILVVKNDGERKTATVKQLFTFDYLGRTECSEVEAGDIAAVVGVDNTDIGDVYTDPENPVELDPIEIDPPTLSIVFEASTSPLVGRDGDIVGARQLKERLFNERENNVTMRIEELPDKSGVEVSGRGILHLSVLMETMRREGYEFQVGRPRVLFKKDENGNLQEPIEQAVVECPDEYAGKVIEVFGNAGGTMTSMETGTSVTHLEFRIPTRGIMGLKNRILNVTHGEGVFYHTFLEYGPYAGEIGGRKNGAMIAMTTEKAVAYALGTLQERGALFVEPGTECYEGMLVGERNQPGDMVVNIARTKNLGNQRSSTADISVQLVPPRTFSLEEALEYIIDDELVEITPKNIRMRKRLLNATDRKKAANRAK
ncbi:translational GTPase TypA [Collinsella stercoris]|uniref:Large ribosomal subunit assembly factor BipA n=1 Tax=Collinsella stercoris DSM 13279 TaxID=445975 RepID=B6GDF8_9ACTN|nr:translational GTPase TypA [Collinsella stercoris]EEA89705.1 GTP-binding protein TypA [Collinsella stercoris DSM 13279]UEA45223.1 translational GTPase TypA [Collinsella stercoris DSM 13279]UWP12252.1 translational GTPase TypA [Collinsella stercoris]